MKRLLVLVLVFVSGCGSRASPDPAASTSSTAATVDFAQLARDVESRKQAFLPTLNISTNTAQTLGRNFNQAEGRVLFFGIVASVGYVFSETRSRRCHS